MIVQDQASTSSSDDVERMAQLMEQSHRSIDRTVKYEDVYLKGYSDPPDAVRNLGPYFKFYNGQRPHQALNYQTPEAVYFGVKAQKTDAQHRPRRQSSFIEHPDVKFFRADENKGEEIYPNAGGADSEGRRPRSSFG